MSVLRIAELVEILNEANQLYYDSGGNSPLSDAEYDELLDELRTLDSTHPLLFQVGVRREENFIGEKNIEQKIVHTVPMLSSAKVKSLSELFVWIEWLLLDTLELLVQPKVDGLSATLYFNKGRLTYIATRGDGNTGQDISHIAPYVKGIVQNLPLAVSVEIRGELYLPKNTDYVIHGRPLRNNCVGLINRKEVSSNLNYVHFVAYTLLNNEIDTSQADRLELLRLWNFTVVEDYLCYTQEQIEQVVHSYLETLRESWLYETDGLVFIVNQTFLHSKIDGRKVVDKYHHYSMALKPPAQSKVSTLEGIEWQLSRQGACIPVGIFTAVQIGGVKITRATLHNAEHVEKLRLHLGHNIILERANDVIPFVRDNLDKHLVESVQLDLIPCFCMSCGGVLKRETVHLKCINAHCPEVEIQSIIYWVKKLNMKEIGAKTIRKLYSLGKIRKPSDLYRLKCSDLEPLDGFADKRIENFLAEVEATRIMEPLVFLSILGIPLVGKKALLKLGIVTMQDFWDFNDQTYVIGKNIIKWRSDVHNSALLKDLLSILILENTKTFSDNRVKESVVFTGKAYTSRKDLTQLAVDNGYNVDSSVTKKTSFLVTDNKESTSNKIKQAKENGVLIMSYDEFFFKIGK